MKEYHYFYKIENNITGKYYYGIHSTTNLEDGYFGSGTALRKAILKYGKENFSKEILKFFDSREELSKYEKKIVSEALISDPKCYNLKTGGDPYNLGGHLSEETKKKIGLSQKGKVISSESRQKMSESQKKRIRQPLTEETRKKISIALKGKSKTDEARRHNSESKKGKPCPKRLGRVRITNDIQDRFIDKEDIQMYLEQGYRLGSSKHSVESSKQNRKQKFISKKNTKAWINNGSNEKQVERPYIEEYLKKGWKKGRVYRVSEENKILCSIINKGRVPWNKGCSWSEEIKLKMRKPKKKRGNE